MRLLRLDLEGFGSFRAPTTLVLHDVDYFAIVGPTGSGKTTLLDAIVFALYGSAPRWGERDLLALAPSTKTATVTLVFELGGKRFAATRKVQRGASGQVNTKEVRLEQLSLEGDLDADLASILETKVATVAGSLREMRPAVQAVVGLSYDQFIQCMVLPQGEFARFLHSGAKERNEVLVNLLGMQVYDRVRAGATTRRAALEAEVGQTQRALAGLSDVTAEGLESLRASVNAVEAVRQSLPPLNEALGSARSNQKAAGDASEVVRSRKAALAEVVAPEDIVDLGERQRSLVTRQAEAHISRRNAETAEAGAEEAAMATGDVSRWRDLVRAHASLVQYRQRHADLTESCSKAQVQLEGAEQGRARAGTRAEEAQEALRVAEAADRAAVLAATLVMGEPCPVCLQPVHALPDRAVADLVVVGVALKDARAALRAQDDAVRAASEEYARVETMLKACDGDIARITVEVADQPDEDLAKASVAAAESAQTSLKLAREARIAAARAFDVVQEEARALDEELQGANADLIALRDRLLSLGMTEVPTLSGKDLAGDWQGMIAWASMRTVMLEAEAARAKEALGEAERAVTAAQSAIADRFAQAGLVQPRDFSARELELLVEHALEEAATRVAEVERANAERARLTFALAATGHALELCKELALRLDNTHFKPWLAREALHVLLDDASETLRELSSGQYELTMDDDDDIVVIDHAEAGATRPVKTLSGGETFQASLAMALALSQQISAMSVLGTKLETLLLDEGFGTLDPEALDLVSGALARLASGEDRTVGVVTHVAELAEQVDFQFRVERDDKGSRLIRVGQEAPM